MSNGTLPDRDAALISLSAPDANQRYLSAKDLVKVGRAEDLNALMVARKIENDAYVRKWLDYAIAACGRKVSERSNSVNSSDHPDMDAELLELARTQAIDWVAGVLLHEIGSKIGLLAATARDEVPNFEQSSTSRHLQNLERIFEGIAELRKAAASPQIKEFDLSELIEEIVSIESADVTVSLVGRKPLLLLGDPNLLRLALCNGVRNAVEAVKTVDANIEHPIVITWEITDREYWISVIDHGPGIAGPFEPLFEIARTNKRGHAGFGLAIARQAMEKLQGTVTLSASMGGGANYEIRGVLIN